MWIGRQAEMKLKDRAVLSIAAIALKALFAASTILAQSSNTCQAIDNFKFVEIASPSADWVFSWDTIFVNSSIKFQYKGGGLSNVWLSATALQVQRIGGLGEETKITVSPIMFSSPIKFRVREYISWSWQSCWGKLRMDTRPTH